MSTHTPGPWLNDHRVILGRAFDGSHKNICDRVRGQTPDAADANACLIAAAPDLLAALRLAVTALLRYDVPASMEVATAVEKANAAIAKATGQS